VRTLNVTSPRRPLVGLLAAVALALAPAACKKDPGPPSEAYGQAHQRFSKLYGQKLDAAYADPSIPEIEGLLRQVPPDSMDAPAANELLVRIRDGRARLESQGKERQAAIDSARTVPSMPSGGVTITLSPPQPPPQPPDAGPPDAGTGKGPQAGTPASELAAGFNGCFRRGQQIQIEGRGFRDSWEMVDRLACRLEYPDVAEKVLIIEADKVLALLAKSDLKVTSDQPPAPDAGR
jgi:hypothetical protein